MAAPYGASSAGSSQHRIRPAVLKAVAEAESSFNPQAVSKWGVADAVYA